MNAKIKAFLHLTPSWTTFLVKLDAFFGEILKRAAIFLRCHFEVPFEHFDKMAQAVVTTRRGNLQDAHIRRTQ